MRPEQAARLRGLIHRYVMTQLTLSHATQSEVRAGALDEDVVRARDAMNKYIRELTTEEASK